MSGKELPSLSPLAFLQRKEFSKTFPGNFSWENVPMGSLHFPWETNHFLICKRGIRPWNSTTMGGAPMRRLPADPAHKGEVSEVYKCRICHEEQTDDFGLVRPCNCSGSMAWVHQVIFREIESELGNIQRYIGLVIC